MRHLSHQHRYGKNWRTLSLQLAMTGFIAASSSLAHAVDDANVSSAQTTISSTIVAPRSTITTPTDLANFITQLIGDPRVKVDIISLPQKPLVPVISGELYPADHQKVREILEELKTQDVIGSYILRLSVGALTKDDFEAKKKAASAENTELWPLSFMSSALNGSEAAVQDKLKVFVEALNAQYPGEGGKPSVRQVGNVLVLRGSAETRQALKHALVFQDATGGQVQLDIWALQVSGRHNQDMEKLLRDQSEKVRIVQQLMRDAIDKLNWTLAVRTEVKNPSAPLPPGVPRERDGKLTKEWWQWKDKYMMASVLADLEGELKFDTHPAGSQSLNNILIHIALADRESRRDILDKAENEIRDSIAHIKKSNPTFDFLRENFQFHQLRLVYGVIPKERDLIKEHYSIREFLEAAVAYKYSLKGKAGQDEFQKRLSARLEDVITEQQLELFPEYRELSIRWKKKSASLDAARSNPDYIKRLEEKVGDVTKIKTAKDEALKAALIEMAHKAGDATTNGDQLLRDATKIDKALAQAESKETYTKSYIAVLEGSIGNKDDVEKLQTATLKASLVSEMAKEILRLAPQNLSRTSSTADDLLKLAVDGFTADIQEQMLRPLLDNLTSPGQQKSTKGVRMVGRSRLVVTSGLESKLEPQLDAYVETTRPAPMSKETLDLAFPFKRSSTESDNTTTSSSASQEASVVTNATGTTPTSTNKASSGITGGTVSSASKVLDNVTGVASAIAGLSTPEAILLAGALNPPTPTFTKVAPGIGITVRPSIRPDGSKIRLNIDATYGVEATQVPNATAKNVLQTPTADTVKSHKVTTDAIVQSFDLFDISSFDISTSYPRPPGVVPVLGTLPLIGPAFQWRRKATMLDHHSTILVNSVILPRSLDIVSFYGATSIE